MVQKRQDICPQGSCGSRCQNRKRNGSLQNLLAGYKLVSFYRNYFLLGLCSAKSFNQLARSLGVSEKRKSFLFSLNVRRLNNKNNEIELCLSSFKYRFDVLAFRETWNSTDFDTFKMACLNYEYAFCTSQMGCGVALYIDDYPLHFFVPEFTVIDTDYESLVIRCKNTVIAAV